MRAEKAETTALLEDHSEKLSALEVQQTACRQTYELHSQLLHEMRDKSTVADTTCGEPTAKF